MFNPSIVWYDYSVIPLSRSFLGYRKCHFTFHPWKFMVPNITWHHCTLSFNHISQLIGFTALFNYSLVFQMIHRLPKTSTEWKIASVLRINFTYLLDTSTFIFMVCERKILCHFLHTASLKYVLSMTSIFCFPCCRSSSGNNLAKLIEVWLSLPTLNCSGKIFSMCRLQDSRINLHRQEVVDLRNCADQLHTKCLLSWRQKLAAPPLLN